MLVYSMSRMKLGTNLATSQQLASHQVLLAIAIAISTVLGLVEMVQKGMLVQSIEKNETRDVASHQVALSVASFKLATTTSVQKKRQPFLEGGSTSTHFIIFQTGLQRSEISKNELYANPRAHNVLLLLHLYGLYLDTIPMTP